MQPLTMGDAPAAQATAATAGTKRKAEASHTNVKRTLSSETSSVTSVNADKLASGRAHLPGEARSSDAKDLTAELDVALGSRIEVLWILKDLVTLQSTEVQHS